MPLAVTFAKPPEKNHQKEIHKAPMEFNNPPNILSNCSNDNVTFHLESDKMALALFSHNCFVVKFAVDKWIDSNYTIRKETEEIFFYLIKIIDIPVRHTMRIS